MSETKPWWQSRTIWMALATALMALLGASGALPIWVTQSMIEELIIAVLAIATAYYRSKAVTEIQPVV